MSRGLILHRLKIPWLPRYAYIILYIPGKIAVVRFTGGYTRDIEIGRVTELGFYARVQFGRDGRYYNQSYVATVKDPVAKSNQGD